MKRVFEDFAKPDGGDERPYGINFQALTRPSGLVSARFIVEEPMPVELSLLSADLIHNVRVALDHVLARMKETFGGNTNRGSFPVCTTEASWQDDRTQRSLSRLDVRAVAFIQHEQPLNRADPSADPLAIVHRLDNVDKHKMLHPAFVYPGAERGVDLVRVLRPKFVKVAANCWVAGEPLDHDTELARFLVRGKLEGALGARRDAQVGFATGEIGAPRTTYLAMVDRVRGIADRAQALIDRADA